MTPTTQQAAFLQALVNTTANLALVARAGCGKTSTILLGVDALVTRFPRAEILVCAFNKAIADEVGAKLKEAGHTDWKTVQASTLHSLGWGLVRFALRLDQKNINEYKVRDIIRAQNEEVFEQYGSQIGKLVELAKGDGFGFFGNKQIGDANAWYTMAEHYDVNGFDDTSDMDQVIEAAQRVYRLSLADTTQVDFNDMILFPLIKNLRVKFGKDFIFMDEAQDLSPARQALARKFVKPHTGRMIIVGDPAQAIYGFSGADADALGNMVKQLSAVELPLSVTWRCPKAVVALAQRIVPDIQAAPSAPEGEVLSLAELPEDLLPTDAILCRNVAPLISTAYKLIRAGKPCKVEGRAIGEGLTALVRRWKIKTIDALINRLREYQDREVQKALAKGHDSKVEEIEDKVATLLEICDACIKMKQTTVADVEAFIMTLFADGATNVTVLASYHRSKGREWERVFLIEDSTRCPSRAAKQEWQLTQEMNLKYVAYTRAKKTLVFVG